LSQEISGAEARVGRIGLTLLLSTAPLVFLPGGYDAWNLPQTALVDVGAFALFLLRLIRARSEGHWRLPNLPFGLPLACLLAWSGLSLLWAPNRYEGAVVLLHWTACVLVLILVGEAAQEPRAMRLPLLGLLCAGVCVSLLGIAQRLWGVDWVPQAFPPAATFGNRIIAAQFVLMTLPLAIGFALEGRGATARAICALAGALMGGYLLYTLTRSAWLALALQGVFVAVWVRRFHESGRRASRAAPLLAAAVLVALVVFAPAGFVRNVSERFSTAWQPPLRAKEANEAAPPAAAASVQGRLAIWRNTLVMIRDFPLLGVGLGNHAVRYPAYARAAVADPLWGRRSQLDYAHNEYLQAWAELGIVGLALFLWLGAAVAALLRRVFHNASSSDGSYLVMAAGAGILGICVDAAFSFPFHRALPPLVSAVYLGILASQSSRRGMQAPAWATAPSAVAAAAALVAIAAFQLRCIRADWHVRSAHEADARRDWPRALAEAEAARRQNAHPREARFAVGTASLSLGDPRRAAQAFEEVLASYPYDLVTLANLALAHAQGGETAKALETLRRAIALDPEEPVLHFRAASLLESAGDAHGALEEYRLAARCDPASRLYQFRWGVAAMQRGAFAEAEEGLGKALAIDPTSAVTHKVMGVLLAESLARRAEGVEHLRQALVLDPRISDSERMRQMVEAYDKEQARTR
jgi:O-antigen ligase/Tfp pilus assembly protein PilF